MPFQIKRQLSRIPGVRRLALGLLRRTSRDITISHPWCAGKIHLNTYLHKGYWFYRKDRERSTMDRFAELIRPGDTVVEVGGHIGFMTQLFSELVGESGRVVVFEPGSNNLPYLRRNVETLGNVRIEESALSDFVGEAVFFEDTITGQNNSLLSSYWALDNVAESHSTTATRVERTVSVRTLDDYVEEHRIEIDFLKMDIEGNELKALQGAAVSLSKVRCLMVEVTEDYDEVEQLLRTAGFRLFDADGEACSDISSAGNYFASRSTGALTDR